MSYYTYLLRCVDGSLYSGITTDPERRFKEHAGTLGGGAKYTAARRPLRFEAIWLSADRAAASRLEYRLKALTRAQKEALIKNQPPEGLDMTGYTRADGAS